MSKCSFIPNNPCGDRGPRGVQLGQITEFIKAIGDCVQTKDLRNEVEPVLRDRTVHLRRAENPCIEFRSYLNYGFALISGQTFPHQAAVLPTQIPLDYVLLFFPKNYILLPRRIGFFDFSD